MTNDSAIPAVEKKYLRELAKKLLDYARLPVMAEKKQLWYLHNRLAGIRPMVVMEEDNFLADILPPSRCSHPLAAKVERQLIQPIAAYETFDDDKVLPDFFPVYYPISTEFLGQRPKSIRASEGAGFHIEPVFETLEEGLPLLRPSEYRCDMAALEKYEKIVEDLIGDILPVVRKNFYNNWLLTTTLPIVELMGMENMYCAMMNEPENFHRLMRLVTDDLKRCLRWQEEQRLLVLNNGNDFMGAGSFCFSDELPQKDYNDIVRSRDLWGHMNGQESIGISPEHFAEFIFPYSEELAAECGLLYYGCCEPVHAYWDIGLCRIPNLRKVSISPWCNEEIMAERLAGGRVIYSRKPSPNLIGVKAEFDEEDFTAYIQKTASAVKGRCKVEFIFRDLYTLRGNTAKTRRAVEITRRIAENMYK